MYYTNEIRCAECSTRQPGRVLNRLNVRQVTNQSISVQGRKKWSSITWLYLKMSSLNTVTEAFRANIYIYSKKNSHNYCGFTEWPVKENWNCIFLKRKVLNYVASLSLPYILRVLRFLVNINYISYNKTQRFCLLCSYIPKSLSSRLTICRLLPALRFCFYCYCKEKREATTGESKKEPAGRRRV